MSETIYLGEMASPIGRLTLYASDQGLLMIGFANQTRQEMTAWLRRHVAAVDISREPHRVIAQAIAELKQYFAGQRREFETPLDLRVQGFGRAVLRQIARVGFGEVTSYGQIARSIGKPQSSRAVGAATGANPLPIVIGCHRVVGSDRKLTGFGGGIKTKRWLLTREGVALSGDRVAL